MPNLMGLPPEILFVSGYSHEHCSASQRSCSPRLTQMYPSSPEADPNCGQPPRAYPPSCWPASPGLPPAVGQPPRAYPQLLAGLPGFTPQLLASLPGLTLHLLASLQYVKLVLSTSGPEYLSSPKTSLQLLGSLQNVPYTHPLSVWPRHIRPPAMLALICWLASIALILILSSSELKYPSFPRLPARCTWHSSSPRLTLIYPFYLQADPQLLASLQYLTLVLSSSNPVISFPNQIDPGYRLNAWPPSSPRLMLTLPSSILPDHLLLPDTRPLLTWSWRNRPPPAVGPPPVLDTHPPLVYSWHILPKPGWPQLSTMWPSSSHPDVSVLPLGWLPAVTWHSSSPRLILTYPSSPQLDPQLLASLQ